LSRPDIGPVRARQKRLQLWQLAVRERPWDASAPRAQAEGNSWTARSPPSVPSTTSEQRSSLTVDLGFLPEPAPLLTALGMRLNEVANHSWDAGVDRGPRRRSGDR
jgi:hypothetical protein